LKQEPSQTTTIAEILLKWYDFYGRSLPWREVSNHYAIWLSEIILQQTRVEQGLPYWRRFLQELPSVHDLAMAETEVVKGLWSGLGYYRRADLLHRAARLIDEQGWPKGYVAWLKIPGVGTYTAAALASILDAEVRPALDGNAYRVYARLSNWSQPIDSALSRQFIHDFSQNLVSSSRPGDFNQAIMDLAQSHCLPKNPKCSECPLIEFCEAGRAGTAASLPIKVRKVRVREELWHFGVVRKGDLFGLVQRPIGGIWSGLYTPVPLEEGPPEGGAECIEHRLSHRKLTLCMHPIAESSEVLVWLTAKEWRDKGMPQAFEHWMTKFMYL
jgi:A/G-specific adenine glycosylase